jgi:peptide/nickel transport system substrate-binding protein
LKTIAGHDRGNSVGRRDSPVSRSMGVTGAVAFAIVIVIGALALSRTAGAQEGGSGPAAAGSTDLLQATPYDRITLVDGSVHVVEPISPRPLPVIDPSRDGKKGRDRKPAIPPEGNIIIGVPTKLERPGGEKEVDADGVSSDEVRLHLLQSGPNEVRDFKVKRSNVKKIDYFEDLLLKECDRLVMAHDYARAFECCLRVETRNPGWSGLDEHVNRVLFAEGESALIAGDGERGLRLLGELLGRNRDYPKLLEKIGTAYSKRIEVALKMGLYARGRRVLHELVELAPDHTLINSMRALFVNKATEARKAAEGSNAPEKLDGLATALAIWPELPEARALYNQAFLDEPTLDVAVSDVAFPLGPWVHGPADARLTTLLYTPILVRDDDDARQGKDAGQLAETIESSDLGRRMQFRIRSNFLWSDGSRPVSAIDVARDLVDRTDPHSPRYEARWADLLDRVELKNGARIEVRLNHSPLKIGHWLLGPVGPAHAGSDGRLATSTRDRPLVTSGVYGCFSATDRRVELRLRDDPAAVPAGRESAGESALQAPARPKIRRIREIAVPQGRSAVGALLGGEVSLIDHVPPDQLTGLASAPEIKVGTYQDPVVHVIAIDGRNPALRSRALRRALSYAVDRKVLLEDHLLKRAADDKNTLADGAFPRGSYADAPSVKPLESQPWLAKMLVAAARKELGGPPISLNLEYPALAEVRAIVPRIAEAFRAAGIEIVITEVLPSRLEAELRAGRRFDLAYRVLRCREPVIDAGILLCPGYEAPPDASALGSAASPRILQLLLQLERAGEWATARGLVLQIDRESRDELPLIPLWQLVDHYAWRDRLTGPKESALDLYEGIATWEIKPWIAIDPWKAP